MPCASATIYWSEWHRRICHRSSRSSPQRNSYLNCLTQFFAKLHLNSVSCGALGGKNKVKKIRFDMKTQENIIEFKHRGIPLGWTIIGLLALIGLFCLAVKAQSPFPVSF